MSALLSDAYVQSELLSRTFLQPDSCQELCFQCLTASVCPLTVVRRTAPYAWITGASIGTQLGHIDSKQYMLETCGIN